jgi:arylsulfatase A-like enzyme
MDVHAPNVPPPPYDGAFEERRPHDVLKPGDAYDGLQYDRELLHLDAELDRLLEGLRARGRLDSTAIVITSDHGEALGDHGFDLHGWTLYEELLHVPLLVKPAVAPGAPPPEAGRSSEPLTGADVFRLVFELAGLEPPAATPPPGAPVA